MTSPPGPQLCERAKVPCDVLLDPLSATLPDHVCADVAQESVRRNAARIVGGWLQAGDLDFWPLGAKKPSRSGLGWDALLLPGGQPIGLIVTRDLARGVVVLVGHVLPSDYGPAYGGRSSVGSPVPGALLGRSWTFVQPSDLTSRFQPLTTHEFQEIERTRRDLLDWYRTTLLGRAPRGIMGRPPGSGIVDDPSFPERLRDAVAALRERRVAVTQLAVAEQLGMSDRALRRGVHHHGLSWSEVARRQ